MPILSSSSPLIRLTDANYGDGIGSFPLAPSAAEIARILFDQAGDMPNSDGMSALMVFWGQFLDHDMSLTRDASGEILSVPGLMGHFQRSVYSGGTGAGDPRQPLNEITPQLDASMIYGSSADRSGVLRSHEGGRLRTSEDPASDRGLLPLAEAGDEMAGASDPLFLAGDIRANETVGLTALHTLLMREHNHWADRLAAVNPGWSDDRLFDTARAIVEVEIQNITYRDWLPALLAGNEALAPVAAVLNPSTGYDPTVNGQISVEFSTAAYRFGHTMVPSVLPMMAESGAEDADGPLTVQQVFFDSSWLRAGHLDDILRGQAGSPAQELDGKVIDDLNFFLTLGDGSTGFSLPALNILRGRDHGLQSYVATRAALLGDIDPDTLAPDDFSVISSDLSVQADLAAVYDNVHQVDLWVGGLIEDRAEGAQMGPLFAWIVAEQFLRTRLADESFGELPAGLTPDMVEDINGTGLREVFLRNTDIAYLQSDLFHWAARVMGTAGDDSLAGRITADLMMGMDGNDELAGRGGADALFGGAGHDSLKGGWGSDELLGEAGDDELAGWYGNDTLDGGAGNDTLRGSHNADLLLGGDGDDLLFGETGMDTLDGGAGDDRLEGGWGHDHLSGGRDNDILIGARGADTLDGGTGFDRLDGGIGRDLLLGGSANDLLLGGQGDDTLDGGFGDDILTGGWGGDTYRFENGFGTDVLTDFMVTHLTERIDLSAVAVITDFDDLVANHLTMVGADAVISDGFGSTITLNGVQAASLTVDEFIF